MIPCMEEYMTPVRDGKGTQTSKSTQGKSKRGNVCIDCTLKCSCFRGKHYLCKRPHLWDGNF